MENTNAFNVKDVHDKIVNFTRTGLQPKSLETYNKIKKMHLNPNTKLKLVPMAHPELDLEENWEFEKVCTNERKF